MTRLVDQLICTKQPQSPAIIAHTESVLSAWHLETDGLTSVDGSIQFAGAVLAIADFPAGKVHSLSGDVPQLEPFASLVLAWRVRHGRCNSHGSIAPGDFRIVRWFRVSDQHGKKRADMFAALTAGVDARV